MRRAQDRAQWRDIEKIMSSCGRGQTDDDDDIDAYLNSLKSCLYNTVAFGVPFSLTTLLEIQREAIYMCMYSLTLLYLMYLQRKLQRQLNTSAQWLRSVTRCDCKTNWLWV